MSLVDSLAYEDRFVVHVDAARLNYLWLKSGLSSEELPAGCKLRKDMVNDHKYHHAEAGFACSHDSPVPLAQVGLNTDRRGRSAIGFTDGVTRTFWLLSNGVSAFPVLVRGEDEAVFIACHAGVDGRAISAYGLFQRAHAIHDTTLYASAEVSAPVSDSDLELVYEVDLSSPDGEVFIKRGAADHDGNFAVVTLFDERRLAVVAGIDLAKRIATMASNYNVGGYGSVVIEPTREPCTHVDDLAWLSGE